VDGIIHTPCQLMMVISTVCLQWAMTDNMRQIGKAKMAILLSFACSSSLGFRRSLTVVLLHFGLVTSSNAQCQVDTGRCLQVAILVAIKVCSIVKANCKILVAVFVVVFRGYAHRLTPWTAIIQCQNKV